MQDSTINREKARSAGRPHRSGQLTSSAREEVRVKRERATSPDLSAVSARPTKKQKRASDSTIHTSSDLPGSARHTRAHDANPHPDCVVCYPKGAAKKVKIEPRLIRHTRAHDSDPHPDCPLCCLPKPLVKPKPRPNRSSRPTVSRKPAKAPRTSISPTPSLRHDVPSSEFECDLFTPLASGDEQEPFMHIKKESGVDAPACKFSSSLTHIRDFLSGTPLERIPPKFTKGRAYSQATATVSSSEERRQPTAPMASTNEHCSTNDSHDDLQRPLLSNEVAHIPCPSSQPSALDPAVRAPASTFPSNFGYPKPFNIVQGTSGPTIGEGLPPRALSPVNVPHISGHTPQSLSSRAYKDLKCLKPSAALPPRLKHKFRNIESSGLSSSFIPQLPSGSATNMSSSSGSSLGVPALVTLPVPLKASPVVSKSPAASASVSVSRILSQVLSSPAIRGHRFLPTKDVGSETQFSAPFASTSSPTASGLFGASSSSGLEHTPYKSLKAQIKEGSRSIYSPKRASVVEFSSSVTEGPAVASTSSAATASNVPHRQPPAGMTLMDSVLSTASRSNRRVNPNGEDQVFRTACSTCEEDRTCNVSAQPPCSFQGSSTSTFRPTTAASTSVVALPSRAIPSNRAARSSTSDCAAFPVLPAGFLTGPGVPGRLSKAYRPLHAPTPASAPFKLSLAWEEERSSFRPKSDSDNLQHNPQDAAWPTRSSALQDLPPPSRPGGSAPSRPNSPEPRRPVRPSLSDSTEEEVVEGLLGLDVAHISEAPSHMKDGAAKEGVQSDVVSRETEHILAVKAESQTEDVIRIPPSPSPKPRCGVPNANLTLRVTYSSEDEPLIVAVRRKVRVTDTGASICVPARTDKTTKSEGTKAKRARTSTKAGVKKENGPDADLSIDNKPKGSKGKTKGKGAAAKIKCNTDSVPAVNDSNEDTKGTGRGKTAKVPRKPRKKAQPKAAGTMSSAQAQQCTNPLSFNDEWQALWSGPASLFPAPAPWAPSAAWSTQGTGGVAMVDMSRNDHASLLPTDGSELRKSETGPVLMHPPRQFAYDPGSLIAYQGCQWDEDGFSGMELSALPWLASTRALQNRDGLTAPSSGQADAFSGAPSSGFAGPDFSLPPDDPTWNVYLQLLADVPATSWAPSVFPNGSDM